MTQLLLFDYPTAATASVASPLPAASPVPITCPAPAAGRAVAGSAAADRELASRRRAARRYRSSASPQREVASESSPVAPLLSGSLPLYEPGKGELHRIGDLAQLVLARYEIVHRRRAARLRRAQSSPGIASQSRF